MKTSAIDILQNKKNVPSLAKKLRGFTLIEMLVVLSVVGILISIGVSQFGIGDRAKAIAAAKETSDAIIKINICHNTSASFNGLSSEVAIGRCAAYSTRVTGVGATLAVTNEYGGLRVFAPANIAGGTDNGFTISDPQIPAGNCLAFVENLWAAPVAITITRAGAPTVVKATKDQVIDSNALYTACGSGGSVSVSVTGAKGSY